MSISAVNTQKNENNMMQPQMQPQVSSVSVSQLALAVETGNQNMLLNKSIQCSFSDVAGFVNRFPLITTKNIIGNMNSKFKKKVSNAVKAYAFNVIEEEIFALFDDTFLGSGKEGFAMTMQGMIIKTTYRETFTCMYSDIRGIKLVYEESSKLTQIYVDTQYGLGYISGSVVETETMANRINEIVKYLYGLEQYPYSITNESH